MFYMMLHGLGLHGLGHHIPMFISYPIFTPCFCHLIFIIHYLHSGVCILLAYVQYRDNHAM